MVWDLDTLKRLNEEKDKKAEKRYVIVYTAEWTSSNYDIKFLKEYEVDNNGIVADIRTSSLEQALILSIEEAKQTWKSMNVKDDWEIWSVKVGLVLDKELL